MSGNRLLTPAEVTAMMVAEFERVTADCTPRQKAAVLWELQGWLGKFPPERNPYEDSP